MRTRNNALQEKPRRRDGALFQNLGTIHEEVYKLFQRRYF